MQVLAVMMHLETKLRQPLRSEENASIEIPAPYVDYQVMDEPDYCKTKEIEGNYGPVSVSELQKCLGNLLPIAHNDIANEYAANEIDVVEELQLVEDNEASEVDNATFVVQEPAEMTMQPSLYMEFDDVRELYASADLWTINEIQEDMVEEVEVGSENDTESLPLVPLQASEIEQILNENMPQYLTNSVQACLPAIDFE
uniref:Uncharacterized protein n=1 Tax=Anopheles minimus TaxID=112268 RepID=A0A182WJY8_9DIPT